MLRRITDLWPTLLRPARTLDNEEEESLLADQGSEDSKDGNLRVIEQELLENHRHMYWSRLVSAHEFELDLMRMWPLGPDVFEDCQAVAELPSIEEGSWAPLFEPTEFNDTHGPLLLEDY